MKQNFIFIEKLSSTKWHILGKYILEYTIIPTDRPIYSKEVTVYREFCIDGDISTYLVENDVGQAIIPNFPWHELNGLDTEDM